MSLTAGRVASSSPQEALDAALDALTGESTSLITLYYGVDATNEQAQATADQPSDRSQTTKFTPKAWNGCRVRRRSSCAGGPFVSGCVDATDREIEFKRRPWNSCQCSVVSFQSG